jgi:hypothetical protein
MILLSGEGTVEDKRPTEPKSIRRIGGYLYGYFCCSYCAEYYARCHNLSVGDIMVYADDTACLCLGWEN